MMSSRRIAELGLLAASLVLVGSVAVVVAGSTENGRQPTGPTVAQGVVSVNTLATAHLPVVGNPR